MSNEVKPNIFQIIKRNVRHLLITKFPTVFFTPHMLKDELNLLKKHTAYSKNIVEFGAGGSTFLFLKSNKNLYTVENSPPFVDLLKSIKYFNKAIATGRLKFAYIDLGPTRGWGKPADETKKNAWITYASKVWDEIPKDVKIDTVFIDGRFRVLTALYSIIKTAPDTQIIIHDFRDRPAYEVVLEFLEPVATASTLFVFKKKNNISADRVNELVQIYRYDVN